MTPLIVQISDDKTTKDTAEYLLDNVDGAKIVIPNGIGELKTIVASVFDTIFYVGHGDSEGAVVDDEFLEWGDFHKIVDTSASMEHIVLTCYSGDIMKTDAGKMWIGFPIEIDAQVGADFSLAIYYSHQNDYESFNHFRIKGISGFIEKMIKGVETPVFLGPIYDDGGGGGSATWDFYYSGIFWDSYNLDPSDEIYYDHPDYDYYYSALGVGPASAFILDYDLGVSAHHISRADVSFWKLGGLLTIAEILYLLGLAAAATIIGWTISVLMEAVAVIFAALGLTAAWIAEVWLQDETGSGWSFFKTVNQSDMMFKIGMGIWIYITPMVAFPIFGDGHYIR